MIWISKRNKQRRNVCYKPRSVCSHQMHPIDSAHRLIAGGIDTGNINSQIKFVFGVIHTAFKHFKEIRFSVIKQADLKAFFFKFLFEQTDCSVAVFKSAAHSVFQNVQTDPFRFLRRDGQKFLCIFYQSYCLFRTLCRHFFMCFAPYNRKGIFFRHQCTLGLCIMKPHGGFHCQNSCHGFVHTFHSQRALCDRVTNSLIILMDIFVKQDHVASGTDRCSDSLLTGHVDIKSDHGCRIRNDHAVKAKFAA